MALMLVEAPGFSLLVESSFRAFLRKLPGEILGFENTGWTGLLNELKTPAERYSSGFPKKLLFS
jgi:hypothetical protein